LAARNGIQLSDKILGKINKSLGHKTPTRLINILLIDFLGEELIMHGHVKYDQRIISAIQTIECNLKIVFFFYFVEKIINFLF